MEKYTLSTSPMLAKLASFPPPRKRGCFTYPASLRLPSLTWRRMLTWHPLPMSNCVLLIVDYKVNTVFKNRLKKSFLLNKKSLYLLFSIKSPEFEEIQFLTLNIASPSQIRKWAETRLPSGKVVGQVLNANTLHHRTLRPLKSGLFCERIFGPIKDFQCACGKQIEKPLSRLNSLKIKERQFCSKCDVEYTWSDKRRSQCGYIQCALPVSHIWFLKSNSSWISFLLDMKKKKAEDITYCAESFTLDATWHSGKTALYPDQILPSSVKAPQRSLDLLRGA
jgi:RNA polymerase Rpb1, domain 1